MASWDEWFLESWRETARIVRALPDTLPRGRGSLLRRRRASFALGLRLGFRFRLGGWLALAFAFGVRFAIRSRSRWRLAVLGVIGDVPARSLEVQCGRRNQPFHFPTAIFMDFQRLFRNPLPDLERFTALVALIIVKRHSLSGVNTKLHYLYCIVGGKRMPNGGIAGEKKGGERPTPPSC